MGKKISIFQTKQRGDLTIAVAQHPEAIENHQPNVSLSALSATHLFLH